MRRVIMRLAAGYFVFLNGILLTTTALDIPDPRVCITKISRRESQYVPYTETYRIRKWGLFHQIRTRINYRIEYSTVWVTMARCCDGYEQVNDKCQPKCSSSCTNGYCAAPERCECNYGYVLSSSHLECVPPCNTECKKIEHAHCTSATTCACDSGYENSGPDNETLTCVPVCETPCTNGKCTGPNLCTCDDGYAIDKEDRCAPKCDPPCLSGNCTAPNTCTCDTGYQLKEMNVCEPICSQPCEMGKCIAPESCSCYDGYGLLNSSSYVCQPICEKACVNGVCTEPGVCTCHEGYRLVGSEEETHICQPYCRIPCEPYGTCTAPNNCSCFDGYRMIGSSVMENEVLGNDTNDLTSACVPICSRDCLNGKCVEPDVCKCNPGYSPSYNDSTICVPICDVSCGPNSVCTEPNVCTCEAGYRLTENDVVNSCEPICETGCATNSNCTSPNVCTCNEGYLKNREGLCEPVCSSCHNGTCVEPNVCSCQNGYILTNESVCVPFCENGCENGDCLGSNECRCYDGFEKSGDNSSCVKSYTRVCKGHRACVDNSATCSYGWMGEDCDQPAVCMLHTNPNDENLDGFVVRNETNGTLMGALQYAPHCHDCNRAADNQSSCFVIYSDDAPPSVGCFIEAESPCYQRYQSDAANISTMAVVLAMTTIVIVVAATTTAYFLIRRHRRNKMQEVIVQSRLLRVSTANEALLPEEDISVH